MRRAPGGSMQRIVRFSQGDTLELKKAHPCGCARFTVLRTGSEVRIVCLGCGRDMTIGREKLDRAVRRVIRASDDGTDGNKNENGSDNSRKDGKKADE